MEAYLVLLCFKVLFLWGVLFFHKWNVCGNSALSMSSNTIFPIAFTHFISLSHFGNSCNTSNLFIIFVMVTCIQCS